MDREYVERLIKEIESIEEASIDLFTRVPLAPAKRIDQAVGDVVVLRWCPDDDAQKTSRAIRRRYEAWYRSTLRLLQEYLPYQESDFASVHDVMESYVTLNRYATTTDDRLAEVESAYPRGYVDIYLHEFANVVDSQATILRSLLDVTASGPPPAYRCFLTGTPCANPVRANPNLVFVIMPFDESYDDRYQLGIREVVRGLGLQCQRADEVVHTRNVICRAICQPIRAARYVVADISERNPNVFYELGLAHGRAEDVDQGDKRVILLTQDIADAPFDLRNMNLIQYESIGSLRARLTAMLIGLMAEFNEEGAPGGPRDAPGASPPP